MEQSRVMLLQAPQQPCRARDEESLHLQPAHSQLCSWDLSQYQTKRNHKPFKRIPWGPLALSGTATSTQGRVQGKELPGFV